MGGGYMEDVNMKTLNANHTACCAACASDMRFTTIAPKPATSFVRMLLRHGAPAGYAIEAPGVSLRFYCGRCDRTAGYVDGGAK